MMNPNYLANKLTDNVISHDASLKKDMQKIRYGLEWLISGANQFILILAFGLFFDFLGEALTCLFGGAILRMFSGGAHFSGYYRCLIFSTIQIVFISYLSSILADIIPEFIVYLTILPLSLIVVFLKAPMLFKKTHLFDLKKRQRARNTSLLVIIIFFIISETLLSNSMSLALWVGVLFQVLSLTNKADLLSKKADILFERM